MTQLVRDVMTIDPVTLDADMSVTQAAEAMKEHDIGDVIVVEGSRLCGIVTDRDIVVRVVASGADPGGVRLVKARRAKSARAHGEYVPRSEGLSSADENRLDDSAFAFPEARKEPLVDEAHVRNAIARFDQVEDVTDAERDRAWKRIQAAANKFGIDVSADDWRELFEGGKAKKR